MSVPTVEQENVLDAWRAGATILLANGGELSNLITTIHRPCNFEHSWMNDRSPHRYKIGSDDIRDVANTIFPGKLAERANSRADLYTLYLARHDRTHRWKRGRHAWGTYFERLVRFPPTGVNQLERAIDKLRNWPKRNTTGLFSTFRPR